MLTSSSHRVAGMAQPELHGPADQHTSYKVTHLKFALPQGRWLAIRRVRGQGWHLNAAGAKRNVALHPHLQGKQGMPSMVLVQDSWVTHHVSEYLTRQAQARPNTWFDMLQPHPTTLQFSQLAYVPPPTMREPGASAAEDAAAEDADDFSGPLPGEFRLKTADGRVQ